MSRHTSESVVGTTILLVCGTGLTTLSRVWGVGPSRASQMAACIGPIAIVLGIGMAIHGRAMPVNRITALTRAWGILGSMIAVLHLWTAGYFAVATAGRRFAAFALPVILLGAWLLPARFYTDDTTPKLEPATDAGRRVARPARTEVG